ncbi:DUF488 domain-containing protein [Brachyspira intermedia]|uniref:DUF488 domain-containing protein n=1 Tax=Brachyspira intermedia TaxID=84377 RepID=UPI00300701F1
MNNTIYTIGYSGLKIEDMIYIINIYKISCIIDTRSIPYSKQFPNFNKENLEKILNNNKILYRNYKEEFGARQKNIDFYSKNGYLDFNKFSKSEIFLNGINKIEKGISKGYTFLLICSEKDPIDCHRTIMVARKFYDIGYNIINIIYNDKSNIIEYTQKDIENRLLNKYFPEREQLLLFQDNYLDQKDLINLSYNKRNEEIGYRK